MPTKLRTKEKVSDLCILMCTIYLLEPQAGIPYSNVLDKNAANWVLRSVGDFYLEESLTTFAGTYDQTTNTYTTDAAAIGATSLYAQATSGI